MNKRWCYFSVLTLVIIISSPVWNHTMFAALFSSSQHLLEHPSLQHLLGTDGRGRDFFMRLIYGATLSILMSIIINLIGILVGFFFGMICSLLPYGSGFNLIESLLSIPFFVLGGICSILLGRSVISLLISFGLMWALGYAYMALGYIQELKSEWFIQKSKRIGHSSFYTIWHHMFPIFRYRIQYQAYISLHSTIFALSSMTFLGFGLQAPLPEMGSFFYENTAYALSHPLLFWTPCLVLMGMAYCIYHITQKYLSPVEPSEFTDPLFHIELTQHPKIYIVNPDNHNKMTHKNTTSSDQLCLQEDYFLNFPNHMPIGQFLADILPDTPHEEFMKHLEKLELSPKILNQFPEELSGGMLQRLSILIGGLSQPQELILENPVSSVEPKLKLAVLQWLNDNFQNKLVIISPMYDSYIDHLGFLIIHSQSALPQRISNSLMSMKPKNLPACLWIECINIQPSFHIPSLKRTILIYHQEILGLIGNSGIGKSTLGHILAQRTALVSGSIKLHSRYPIRAEMVEQSPDQFNQELTTYQIIKEFSNLLKKDLVALISPILEQLELSYDVLNKKMGHIAKAEQYKILLIRAVVYKPNLLILDEMFDHLPYSSYAPTLSFLQTLVETSQITIILIGHQQEWIQKICHRTIQL